MNKETETIMNHIYFRISDGRIQTRACRRLSLASYLSLSELSATITGQKFDTASVQEMFTEISFSDQHTEVFGSYITVAPCNWSVLLTVLSDFMELIPIEQQCLRLGIETKITELVQAYVHMTRLPGFEAAGMVNALTRIPSSYRAGQLVDAKMIPGVLELRAGIANGYVSL